MPMRGRRLQIKSLQKISQQNHKILSQIHIRSLYIYIVVELPHGNGQQCTDAIINFPSNFAKSNMAMHGEFANKKKQNQKA